ncbi:MAG TPA: hypothetical protein PL110_02700 [Candidatus Eremiobacteraeota bacterium]|nr:hypothetical protein [Candidatus Eremiobacteraeota bacterium]
MISKGATVNYKLSAEIGEILQNLKKKDLNFIEDRNDLKGQWKKSWLLFEHFYRFLKDKGLKPETISSKVNSVVIFMMNYTRLHTEIKSINEICGEDIYYFIAAFYPSLFPSSTPEEIKAFKLSIIDFYTFLRKKEFISQEKLKKIKGYLQKS